MTDSHQHTARLVKAALDHRLENESERLQLRLATARQSALSQYKPAEERSTWWKVSHVLHLAQHPFAYSASACLLTLAIGAGWWMTAQDTQDQVDVDTQLLTDELPPHAYLDEQFSKWLEDTRNPS
ncbi:DUF3619 family protein [Leeia oryzae]|uniref:DUF3619 family protein n=1 Tax=Leeia oryzae TaxID=356662 RepID=UPI000366D8E7|nr:DUF3619 family protein [Leeia oryzae]